MQREAEIVRPPSEQAAYFEVPGSHLYTVLHRVANPVARALLVGPFASERHFSYIPWVRWARYLAAKGIECLRYDYRGVGESTGVFEDMSFETWQEDVTLLAGWLKSQSPDRPLVMHGLQLGGLLAAKVFYEGVGDALLLWSPASNANEVLRQGILQHIAVDHTFKNPDDRKPLSSYFQQLETGKNLEVEGYRWTTRLWQDSFQFENPFAKSDTDSVSQDCRRPVRSVTLPRSVAPLVKGSSLGYVISLNPDLSPLFGDNLAWISSALNEPAGRDR